MADGDGIARLAASLRLFRELEGPGARAARLGAGHAWWLPSGRPPAWSWVHPDGSACPGPPSPRSAGRPAARRPAAP
jgi:hypothetical protein